MQFPAQIQAAIELLQASFETRRPADRLMAQYFRDRRYIGAKDKAVIARYFYAAVRARLSLGYLLEQRGLVPLPHHILAAQLKLQGYDLIDIFSGQRHQPACLASGVINALQGISRSDLAAAPEYVRLEVPQWLAVPLKESLGSKYVGEMKAVQQRADIDIRINISKVTPTALIEDLRSQGIDLRATPLSPWGARLTQRGALFNTAQFKRGEFEIQDEGSQLLALFTDVRAGQTVVDFCAGAGGKTLAMSAMMENKGTIYACDVHDKRLIEAKKRARRAGAHNIRYLLLTSERDKWVKQHAHCADVVLVDAPCSGSGTWRRSPDSRWNLSQERLDQLIALQASILQHAARLVKPGGRLIYSTCSLLHRENEQQAAQFQSVHPEFKPAFPNQGALIARICPQIKGKEPNHLRLYSARHGCDGFFAVAFSRAE